MSLTCRISRLHPHRSPLPDDVLRPRIGAHHQRHVGGGAASHRQRVHRRTQAQHLRSADNLQRDRLRGDGALLPVDVVGGPALVVALIVVRHIVDDQPRFVAALQEWGARRGEARDSGREKAKELRVNIDTVWGSGVLLNSLLHPFVCGLRIALADALESGRREQRRRGETIRSGGQDFRGI